MNAATTKTEQDGAKMDYASTHDLIGDLKKSKDEQSLSLTQIKDMLAEIGFYPSMTTLRRVFREGSEDETFNYESTLRPLMRVLIKNDSPDSKVALYEDALRYKADVIDSLHRQIDQLKEEQSARCAECQKRIDFLQEQIALKDRRMDEQAKRIDKLMDALLEKM